MAHGAALISVS